MRRLFCNPSDGHHNHTGRPPIYITCNSVPKSLLGVMSYSFFSVKTQVRIHDHAGYLGPFQYELSTDEDFSGDGIPLPSYIDLLCKKVDQKSN